MNTPTRLALAIPLALAMLPVAAQQQKPRPYAPSAMELIVLPDYCRARIGPDSTAYQQWNQRMGPDKFVHLHHFCHGLNHLNRANGTVDKYLRNYYLGVASNEFDYVIRNWPDGFELKSEALERKKLVGIMQMRP